jgi:LacI family transcriptional regulator
MAVTMKDIAAQAGVTQSAVSAVLNGTTASRVSPKKRELILKISRELNYHRNFAATALKKRETKLLGLVCGSLISPYFSELTMAINEIATARGYRLILALLQEGSDTSNHDYLNRLANNMCDGIIMYGELKKEKQTVQNIMLNCEAPFIMLGSIMDKISSICFDYYVGMKKAFDELLRQGHRKIAFAGHPGDINKQNAYRECCCKCKIEPVEYYISPDHDLNFAFECGAQIAASRKRQSALICTDYALNIIYPGMISAGLNIPQDLSVIAFNNTRQSRCFVPALTSISLDTNLLARYSVDILLEQIKQKDNESDKIKNILIPPELIIRDSIIPSEYPENHPGVIIGEFS